MEEVFKDPVQFSKGINLRELMTSGAEFHIDMDFKKKSHGTLLNADEDLFPELGDEDSDTEDVLKNIEESTDKSMLSSPEYHSFDKLAAQMVDCLPSGDVKMLVIEEGDGPLVPVDAEVTIHYAAYWEKASIPFDSTLTMNFGTPQRLRLGVGRVLPGLEVGLTMVRGPTARFHLLLQPRVAWGERGVPPRIKPEPALFVIVLYDVKDVQAAERFNDLPQEEQAKFEVTTRTVKALNSQSKDLFTRRKYTNAIKNYQQAISVLNLSRPKDDNEEAEVKKLKISAYLNMAVCYYKIKKPKYIIRTLESLDYVTNVENNCKAMFYYGRANEMLGKTEQALDFYEKALKMEPKNKDIGKALSNLDSYIKKSSIKEKEMWQTVFKSEKKEVVEVDEEFQNGVRELFKDFSCHNEYGKFDLPKGLNRHEVDFVKALAKDFEGLVVQEDGEGKKRKVSIVRKLL